ncbi:MAG TPA: glycoside hydrolase family 76 protein [Streptosporangiaceae bacterium]
MKRFGNLQVGLSLIAATAIMTGIVVGAPSANALTYPSSLCDKFCDARDPAQAAGNRVGPTSVFDGRRLALHFDDADNMAWASIDGGTPGDQAWLDRSFDGGYDWSPYGSKLGQTTIPSGNTGWRTLLYNLDQWSSTSPLEGVVRACGQTGSTISCTAWARTTWNAADNQRAAATALMETYDLDTKLFDHNTVGSTGYGWWNSANDLTALIDSIRVTGMGSYQPAIGWTYAANKPAGVAGDANGDFKNNFIDDTGWWAMAWIDAYDLTRDSAYLTTAEDDANYMNSYWDSTCGGGVWWSTAKTYKNAIANELYLYVNAALHNRIAGDTTYLNRAEAEQKWFASSGGMINSSDLINDGLMIQSDGTCVNNGGYTWTYNQGVILEGLTELYKATQSNSYLSEATALADASTGSSQLNPVSATAPEGELADPASDVTSGDAPTFKGAYIRGLTDLNNATGLYGCYLARQSAVAYLNDRNPADQYGYSWAGPWSSTPQSGPDQPTSAQQGSALFLANAGPAITSPSDPAVTTALNCTGS